LVAQAGKGTAGLFGGRIGPTKSRRGAQETLKGQIREGTGAPAKRGQEMEKNQVIEARNILLFLIRGRIRPRGITLVPRDFVRIVRQNHRSRVGREKKAPLQKADRASSVSSPKRRAPKGAACEIKAVRTAKTM